MIENAGASLDRGNSFRTPRSMAQSRQNSTSSSLHVAASQGSRPSSSRFRNVNARMATAAPTVATAVQHSSSRRALSPGQVRGFGRSTSPAFERASSSRAPVMDRTSVSPRSTRSNVESHSNKMPSVVKTLVSSGMAGNQQQLTPPRPVSKLTPRSFSPAGKRLHMSPCSTAPTVLQTSYSVSPGFLQASVSAPSSSTARRGMSPRERRTNLEAEANGCRLRTIPTRMNSENEFGLQMASTVPTILGPRRGVSPRRSSSPSRSSRPLGRSSSPAPTAQSFKGSMAAPTGTAGAIGIGTKPTTVQDSCGKLSSCMMRVVPSALQSGDMVGKMACTGTTTPTLGHAATSGTLSAPLATTRMVGKMAPTGMVSASRLAPSRVAPNRQCSTPTKPSESVKNRFSVAFGSHGNPAWRGRIGSGPVNAKPNRSAALLVKEPCARTLLTSRRELSPTSRSSVDTEAPPASGTTERMSSGEKRDIGFVEKPAADMQEAQVTSQNDIEYSEAYSPLLWPTRESSNGTSKEISIATRIVFPRVVSSSGDDKGDLPPEPSGRSCEELTNDSSMVSDLLEESSAMLRVSENLGSCPDSPSADICHNSVSSLGTTNMVRVPSMTNLSPIDASPSPVTSPPRSIADGLPHPMRSQDPLVSAAQESQVIEDHCNKILFPALVGVADGGHSEQLAAARATLLEIERDLGRDDVNSSTSSHSAEIGMEAWEPSKDTFRLSFYRQKCTELYKNERQLREDVKRRDAELERLREALREAGAHKMWPPSVDEVQCQSEIPDESTHRSESEEPRL